MVGLQKLDKVINWDIFRKSIEDVLHVELKPPYDYLLMFKIIILQKYYNLSDEKTIWLFKEQLKEKKLTQKLFDLFTTQLIGKSIVAREGSIIDASFVDVPKQRNSCGEKKR